jgi:hypothetical protein
MKRIAWFIVPVLLSLLSGLSGSVTAAGESEVFLPLITQRVPELGPISEPLLVDEEGGRIYAQAEVDGEPRTVVLATATGALRRVFNPAGRLGLDRDQQQLLIDQGDAGVLLLDTSSGEQVGTFSIPGEAVADPQIDPGRNRGFVFRDSTIHVLDLETQTEAATVELPLSISVCGDSQGKAPITRSFYEPAGEILFVSATSYVCTPFIQETIISYDSNLEPVGQFDYANIYQAVPFAGNLYGSSVLRGYQPFGLSYWAHNATEEWHSETVVGSDATLKGIVVDGQRNLLYEAIWEYPSQGESERKIRVSRTGDRVAIDTVPWAQLGLGDARLAGHDAQTDQLYFLEEGVLHILPTDILLAAADS